MTTSTAAKGRTQPRTDVILIGLGQHPGGENLAHQLHALGMGLKTAGSPDALPELLSGGRRAAVVVYSPRESARAGAVLEKLQERLRQPPVIVLVDEADFSEYYELMARGASDYYEMSEGIERIARAVQRAARARAS